MIAVAFDFSICDNLPLVASRLATATKSITYSTKIPGNSNAKSFILIVGIAETTITMPLGGSK